MERNVDDEQERNKAPVKEGHEHPPGRSNVREVRPTFRSSHRFAQMTDVVSQRSATFMPPTVLDSHVSAPTDAETATTTTTRHEEKQKSYPISGDHVRANLQFSIPEPTIKPYWEETPTPPRYSSWNKVILNKLPKYFPLERTNRSIRLEEGIEALLSRLAVSFRAMSIQAKFFDRSASAALLTPENVELYLALWESDNENEVIVEVQRRRGDALIFHQYARHILDAASGTFRQDAFDQNESSILYLQSAEKKLKMELSRAAHENKGIEKESIVALEIVYELLKKDRRDARRLGMESVCILADARKTCLSAAILTSRALLLGDQSITGQGLHEILLGIIQKRSLGQDEVNMGEFGVEDDENFFPDDDDLLQNYSPEYKEEMSLMFNLALDALAHALEVATTFELVYPVDDSAFSPNFVVDTFLVEARQCTAMDMLTTLLETLQRAHVKPHNAWLACKCLRYICAASPDAAQRLIKLGGMQFLEQAFNVDMDSHVKVAVDSHAKLESECRVLQGVLTK